MWVHSEIYTTGGVLAAEVFVVVAALAGQTHDYPVEDAEAFREWVAADCRGIPVTVEAIHSTPGWVGLAGRGGGRLPEVLSAALFVAAKLA